nr:gephyrin-like molybdotransferase receptor GlpR [Nocardia sp. CNY236]
MTTPADEPVTESDGKQRPAPAPDVGSDIADRGPERGASEDDITGAGPEVDAAPIDEDARPPALEPIAARIPPARSTKPAHMPVDDDTEPYLSEEEFVPSRRGRGGFDPEADAIARVARYTFRQRAVLCLLLTALGCGVAAFVLIPVLWWACGLAAGLLVGYLAYLRRQVRMEEEIRRRRAARLNRGQRRGDVDPRSRRVGAHQFDAMDRDTARALRRRSAHIEPDDEDPMFDHLDPFDPATARALRARTSGNIDHAAGA